MKSHNLRSVLRIEHKTHQNEYLKTVLTDPDKSPIHSGLYSFFSEFNPYKSLEFKPNLEALQRSEKLKKLQETIYKLEEDGYNNSKERELRDRICEKGKAGLLNGLGVTVSWNYKRPNAYVDPYLREIYLKFAYTKRMFPLYGFRDKQTMMEWFDNDESIIRQILDTDEFEIVRYRVANAFHGLRQSIFYPGGSSNESRQPFDLGLKAQ